jgi:hypothetical protein
MRRFRFRIGTLLILIIVLGVAFGALRESSDIWDSGVFTLALTILLVSILLAIHRTEKRRVFWMGFALFGAAYMAMSLVPSIESRLITTKALTFLDSKLLGRSLASNLYSVINSGVRFAPDGSRLATASQGQVKIWDGATGKLVDGWSGTTENFVRIGHSLFALLAGWFGGLLSRRQALESSSAVDEGGTAIPRTGQDPQ